MRIDGSADRRFAITVVAAVAIGIVIRWLVLRGANWRIDYDEGMVGLQVLRILRGQFDIFHPGQPYLGNVESYLIAPFFLLFGANDATLKLVPLLLSGVYVGTTGLVARSAFGARIGALAALAAAVAPAYLVVVGLKTWGATIETLVCGNVLLLVGLRILNGSDHARRDWLLLGLVTGMAFWISWLIVFYAAPFVLVGLRHVWRDRQWRMIPLAAIAFFVGGLPFWVYNILNPAATFKFLIGGKRVAGIDIAQPVMNHFVVDLAPRLVSGDPAWRLLDVSTVWVLVAIYSAGLIALIVTRRRTDERLLTAFVILFLPIYILSGFGFSALNPFGIDATGRYVLMLHSVLPIGLALLTRWKQRIGTVVLTCTLGFNLAGIARIDPVPVFVSPYYRQQPASLQPLVDLLDARGITHIWTDVGIAHVLMFETHERILAEDYYDAYVAHGLMRFPEVIIAIIEADKVAYVELIQPGQTDTPIERAFVAAGIAYERLTPTPQILVIIPRERIDPAKVLPGLGFQY